ncbi:hypothetical protein AB0C34_17530 [Nocardia sp. NPDC049220]|uniref:hypothetical protein n=1 Tax=Nocardia sp. NPDC049220 TaxID=3155273 RepID=UPI00340B7306
MTSDIDSRTVDFKEIDLYAEDTDDKRYVWNDGRKTADSTAAELWEVAQKLTALRRLPLKPVPYSDPGEWFEPSRVPTFPFTLDTVEQMFGTLIGHIQLMAYRYEDESRELTQALAELDAPLEVPTELRGCMSEGYTPEKVNSVLGHLANVCGVRIVCVWERFGAYGFAGNCDFYIESNSGEALYYLVGGLRAWLNTSADDPQSPATPGEPASWVGGLVSEFTHADFAGGDNSHNYAIHNNE